MPEPARGDGGGPRRRIALLAALAGATPIDLRLVGRTLLHAALVGVAAGLVGAAFYAALELGERALLEGLAGYRTLRADGERFLPGHGSGAFRPWVLVLLPAVGGLVCGGLIKLAPEVAGGGGDAMIAAFHHAGARLRRRVAWVKALASIATLSTGGAGGREGPTMLIGGALGSLVADSLRVGTRERRILMIAGVAAGISAVFRTPLGAALLAVEVLYRDDFETDALIPALLASVVAYSVFISLFGETTLFAHAPRFPFVPAHLPLYALLAVLVSILAIVFETSLHGTQRLFERSPVPRWLRPALGGLALGAFATLAVVIAGRHFGTSGQGLGILGGGYGAAQLAITPSPWIAAGWEGVLVLLALCGAKLLATSLTVGSGGSAGDFAPSLTLGGLFGGAFGRAAQILTGDPRIDAGAFALVGMGTFYGGIAHVPIGSLVMVCELAGSYDLLVPLMLAEGIAFVALRRTSLYRSQPPTKRESPAHAVEPLEVLSGLRVDAVMIAGRPFVELTPKTSAADLLHIVASNDWQDVFPVLDEERALVGMVTTESVRVLASEHSMQPWAIAADLMQPPVTLRPEDDLRRASELFLATGARELPVVDGAGAIVGFCDESDVARAYLGATTRPATRSSRTPS